MLFHSLVSFDIFAQDKVGKMVAQEFTVDFTKPLVFQVKCMPKFKFDLTKHSAYKIIIDCFSLSRCYSYALHSIFTTTTTITSC